MGVDCFDKQEYGVSAIFYSIIVFTCLVLTWVFGFPAPGTGHSPGPGL